MEGETGIEEYGQEGNLGGVDMGGGDTDAIEEVRGAPLQRSIGGKLGTASFGGKPGMTSFGGMKGKAGGKLGSKAKGKAGGKDRDKGGGKTWMGKGGAAPAVGGKGVRKPFLGYCHVCGLPGLSQKLCPKEGKGFWHQCHRCGITGHRASECPHVHDVSEFAGDP
jgi:hypothetical protein